MESGPFLWLLLLTIGVAALGAAIAYGMNRNKQRTATEKMKSDVATKQEYRREDRDAS